MPRSRLRAALTAILLASAALGATTWASAQASGADARRFFESAQKAFDEGRYVDAAHAFEEAFKIKAHPAPLINAGDAWEKAGEYALAARRFEQVLTLPEADEQDKTDATDRLARLKPQLGTLKLVGDPKLRVKVGDEEFTGGAVPYLFPGSYQVSLVDVDGTKTRKVTVPAGGSASIDLATLLPTAGGSAAPTASAGAPGAPPIDAPPNRGIRPVTWVSYGVGVVGLGSFALFGLQANSSADAFDARPNREDYDDFNRAKLFANVGLGVGVVGLALGTVFLISDLSGGNAPARTGARLPRFDVAPLPSGGFISAAGQF